MDLSGNWRYLNSIVRKRLKNNWTSRQETKFKNLEILGAAGELAARRYLGLPEKIHTHFDGGADLFWRNRKVDVKATNLTRHFKHRFLQWPIDKPVKADIILMTVVDLEEKQACVIGYAFKDEILGSEINHTRYYPCREIAFVDLHPAWQLFTLSQRRNGSKTSKRSSKPAKGTTTNASTGRRPKTRASKQPSMSTT